MSYCRFIHCSDLHLGVDVYGVQDRIEDYFRGFIWVLDQARDRNVDFVLISGDLFDRRQVRPAVLRRTSEILHSYKDSFTIFTTPGNHDRSLLSGEMNWVDYLAHEGLVINLDIKPDVTERHGITQWTLGDKRGAYYESDAFRIWGLGYLGAGIQPRLEQIASVIDEVSNHDKNKPNLLMLHAGLLGGMHAIDGGVKQDELSPLLRHCVYIALGHAHSFHMAQSRIFTPGCVEAVDLREFIYKRGALYAEVDATGEILWEHLPYKGREIIALTIPVDKSNCPDPDTLCQLVYRTFSGLHPDQQAIYHVIITGEVEFDRFAVEIKQIRTLLKQLFTPFLLLIDLDISRTDGALDEAIDPHRIEASVYELLARGNTLSIPSELFAEFVVELQGILDSSEESDTVISESVIAKCTEFLNAQGLLEE